MRHEAYSSCVRRIWRLPLDTYTYLVEGHLSLGFSPLRNMVLSRYPAFYQHMLASPCTEVSVLAELFSKDARSTTAENLSYVSAITGLNFFKCVFGHQYYTNINEHLFQKCEEQTFDI